MIRPTSQRPTARPAARRCPPEQGVLTGPPRSAEGGICFLRQRQPSHMLFTSSLRLIFAASGCDVWPLRLCVPAAIRPSLPCSQLRRQRPSTVNGRFAMLMAWKADRVGLPESYSHTRMDMMIMARSRTGVRALLTALTLTVAGSATAWAQAATITGRVTNESGVAITGANVFIEEVNAGTTTGATGSYTLSVPAAQATGQTVRLSVRFIGFTPSVRSIQLTPGPQTQDFQLKLSIIQI